MGVQQANVGPKFSGNYQISRQVAKQIQYALTPISLVAVSAGSRLLLWGGQTRVGGHKLFSQIGVPVFNHMHRLTIYSIS